MTLGELIAALEAEPDHIASEAVINPHSYRGYYDELAFETQPFGTVREMLDIARSAVGETYTGWKGGEYTMDEYTPVHLATIGDCGEPLTIRALRWMLREPMSQEGGGE